MKIWNKKEKKTTGARDGSVHALCARKYANQFSCATSTEWIMQKIYIAECDEGTTRVCVCIGSMCSDSDNRLQFRIFRFDWIHWVAGRCSCCYFFGDQKSARNHKDISVVCEFSKQLMVTFGSFILLFLCLSAIFFFFVAGPSEQTTTSKKGSQL